MSENANELSDLLDRDRVRNCIVRLARGEDRRDANLIGACYWPDSTTDYGVFKGSFQDYLAWVVPGSPAIIVTQHILGQTYVELRGSQSVCETHVMSYHRINTGAEERDTLVSGRYLDKFEKRGGNWRIANRVMLYDWYRDFGVSVDWAQGIMGLPFSADHFTGRTIGDHSELFMRQALQQ